MYNNERCLIFDESGNLGKNGKYFVIACIDTIECKALHNIMKRKLKKAKDTFPELNKNTNEIKAFEAHPAVKHHILESIVSKNVAISYIVADLEHIEEKLLEDKNILYNYLMKLLVIRLITKKDEGQVVNIICDNKTIKVASTNSLAEYLKLTLVYETGYDIKLNVRFLDSAAGDAYVVQAADYVANAIYAKYEKNNKFYSDTLKSSFNRIVQFPYKKFGK